MLNLTGLNGVRCALSTVALAGDTTISLSSVKVPYIFPPDPRSDFYYLTLIDYTNRPGAWERVKVTGVSGSDLAVERNVSSGTGSAIEFSAGSVIQWTPGVEEIYSPGKIILAAGGPNDLYYLVPTSAFPVFISPVPLGQDDGISAGFFDDDARWYNNTGKTLTISQLFVGFNFLYATTGDYTFTVQVNGVDSLITVSKAAAAAGPLIIRDEVNTATIADGEYISIKISNSSAEEAGGVNLNVIQLVLS